MNSQASFTTTTPGNFTVAHGLGSIPASVVIVITTGGAVWFQTVRYDATNVYLVASDTGLTGYVISSTLPDPTSVTPNSNANFIAPAPGNLTIPHGLGATPTVAVLSMTSSGIVWFQQPPYDDINLYLVASDAGMTGSIATA